MVTRAEATIENNKLIAAALNQNRLVLAARASGKITAGVEQSIASLATGVKRTNDAQTNFSSNGLNDTIKRLQQELSELWGIPTFDMQGNISTIPLSRPINPNIDVGTGIFTEDAFVKSLGNLSAIGGIASNAVSPIKDIFATGIEEYVREVFSLEDRTKFTAQELAVVEAIERRISDLENLLIPVPECTSMQAGSRWVNSNEIRLFITNCAAHDAATAHNAAKKQKIEELKVERLRFITENPIFRQINDKAEELKEAMRQLLEVRPITAAIKAEISTKATQIQTFLTEIEGKKTKLSETTIAELQLMLKAGGFRLQEQTSAAVEGAAAQSTDLLAGARDFFKGVTESFEGFGELGSSIAAALYEAFNPSPEQMEKRRLQLGEWQQTQLAKEFEAAQKFVESKGLTAP